MLLYSIGYQGKSLEGLCAKLADNAVEILIDVRERAWSNRPEFRKGALAEGLKRTGIEYLHLRSAGNPFRPRKGVSVQRELCLEYYSNYLANSPDVVNSVATLSRNNRSALFCYEANADECHRGVLIAALLKLNPDLTVVYL
ncbi:MAG TPA: DUF488 domain-containing protein [Candidatus Acidoferrum sp.]|nr:DUF488 domain-containing protein [Candidatus Acidoferrum sp.]